MNFEQINLRGRRPHRDHQHLTARPEWERTPQKWLEVRVVNEAIAAVESGTTTCAPIILTGNGRGVLVRPWIWTAGGPAPRDISAREWNAPLMTYRRADLSRRVIPTLPGVPPSLSSPRSNGARGPVLGLIFALCTSDFPHPPRQVGGFVTPAFVDARSDCRSTGSAGFCLLRCGHAHGRLKTCCFDLAQGQADRRWRWALSTAW